MLRKADLLRWIDVLAEDLYIQEEKLKELEERLCALEPKKQPRGRDGRFAKKK